MHELASQGASMLIIKKNVGPATVMPRDCFQSDKSLAPHPTDISFLTNACKEKKLAARDR